jgi:signal transduction histidine kinase
MHPSAFSHLPGIINKCCKTFRSNFCKSRISINNSVIELTIEDNGKGFDATQINKKKTLGLLGMKERTIMLGGNYIINSEPGKGTAVIVSVPLSMHTA